MAFPRLVRGFPATSATPMQNSRRASRASHVRTESVTTTPQSIPDICPERRALSREVGVRALNKISTQGRHLERHRRQRKACAQSSFFTLFRPCRFLSSSLNTPILIGLLAGEIVPGEPFAHDLRHR